jgi:hypothetical protein
VLYMQRACRGRIYIYIYIYICKEHAGGAYIWRKYISEDGQYIYIYIYIYHDVSIFKRGHTPWIRLLRGTVWVRKGKVCRVATVTGCSMFENLEITVKPKHISTRIFLQGLFLGRISILTAHSYIIPSVCLRAVRSRANFHRFNFRLVLGSYIDKISTSLE